MVTPYRVRPRFSFKTKQLELVCEFLATYTFTVLIARITASTPFFFKHPTLKEWLLQHARLSWEVLDLLQGEAER